MRNVIHCYCLWAVVFGMLALKTHAQPSAFTYPPGPNCQSVISLLPSSLNTPGSGSFSEGTGNVVFADNVTGEINMLLSNAGTWSIKRVVGADSTVHPVTITAPDVPGMAYIPDSACVGAANFVIPLILGTAGGTFSSVSSALILNSSTGAVDLNNTPPGVYGIAYTSNGLCPVSVIDTLTILAASNAFFSYPSSFICLDGDTVYPDSIIMPLQGTFHAITPGINIDSLTGAIYSTNSQSGTYTVEYTIDGYCPGQWQATVTVAVYDHSPLFIFPDSFLCSNDSPAYPIVLGPTSILFSCPGLTFHDLNAGAVDPSGTPPGTYTMTATNVSICNETWTQTLVIGAQTLVQISISGDTLYAPGDGSNYQWYMNGLPVVGANDSTYFTNGVFAHYQVYYDLPMDSCGAYGNYFLVTGVAAPGAWLRGAHVYPNPSAGEVRYDISLMRPEVLQWNLYNSMGTCVASGKSASKVTTFQGQWDWAWLPAGHYCLRLQTPTGSQTRSLEILK